MFWTILFPCLALVLWAEGSLQIENIYYLATIFAVVLSPAIYFVFLKKPKQLDRSDEAQSRADRRTEVTESNVRRLHNYIMQLEKNGEELRASREEYRAAAHHDGLTGLANRSRFIEVLKERMRQPLFNGGARFAVLFLDLDRFKMVNDSLGHLIGDRLIVQVAERLTEAIGSGGLVARFGGDEFAVLLLEASKKKNATQLADEIAEKITSSYQLDDKRVFVGASIGIAYDNSNYCKPEEILRDADIAMYYAKEAQKNWVVFDAKMHKRAVSMLELETDLRYAIERDEVELFYQPIILLDRAELTGFEALARWRHPSRGIISPSEFIDVCEETGLIVPMTINLLRRACQDLVNWQLLSPENKYLNVSVNVSGRHFADPALVDQIRDVLDETGVYPPCLKLEITESVVMENAEHTISILNRIKEMGVRLSIDDFGTGYSSLSYLHRFPIDTLKIDRSFVSAMEDGTENGEIVRTIITLAKALKMNVVAEGIESIHQLHQLRILECEYGQGFLFARPVPASNVMQMFSEQTVWRNIPPMRSGVEIFPQPGAPDYIQLAAEQ